MNFADRLIAACTEKDSVDCVGSDPRLDRIPAPDLLIIDEAHHVASKSWARIVERWPNAFIVGLTATPARLDGKGLAEWFDELILGPSVAELIEDVGLCKTRVMVRLELDRETAEPVETDAEGDAVVTDVPDGTHLLDAESRYDRNPDCPKCGKATMVKDDGILQCVGCAKKFRIIEGVGLHTTVTSLDAKVELLQQRDDALAEVDRLKCLLLRTTLFIPDTLTLHADVTKAVGDE